MYLRETEPVKCPYCKRSRPNDVKTCSCDEAQEEAALTRLIELRKKARK